MLCPLISLGYMICFVGGEMKRKWRLASCANSENFPNYLSDTLCRFLVILPREKTWTRWCGKCGPVGSLSIDIAFGWSGQWYMFRKKVISQPSAASSFFSSLHNFAICYIEHFSRVEALFFSWMRKAPWGLDCPHTFSIAM